MKFLKDKFELNWIYNSERESELNWILKSRNPQGFGCCTHEWLDKRMVYRKVTMGTSSRQQMLTPVAQLPTTRVQMDMSEIWAIVEHIKLYCLPIHTVVLLVWDHEIFAYTRWIINRGWEKHNISDTHCGLQSAWLIVRYFAPYRQIIERKP